MEVQRKQKAAAAPLVKPGEGGKSLSELVDMELQGLDSSKA